MDVNFSLYSPGGNGHSLPLGSRVSLQRPKAIPVACLLAGAVSGVGVLECLLPVWYHDLPFQVQESCFLEHHPCPFPGQ